MRTSNDPNGFGMETLVRELRTAWMATVWLGLLLCGVYPLLVWGVAQGLFPHEANGSLVVRDGRAVGSSLIGQKFAEAGTFHPRPSAAGDGYDATRSGGSNLGPTSRKLIQVVEERILQYRLENGLLPESLVPADAVTASSSGLDPHISVRNALLQAHRVASARGLSKEAVIDLIHRSTLERDLGILGEPRVNVLLLNLDLYRIE